MSQPNPYAQPESQISASQERTMGAIAHGVPLIAMAARRTAEDAAG